MTIDDKIRDEKLIYDINRAEAKISASSSGRINKYENLTGEEVFPQHHRIIEEVKLTYSQIGKAVEKETKTMKSSEKNKLRPYSL